MYIYQIAASCTKHLHITVSDIFVPTASWRMDTGKILSFPVSFFSFFHIVLNLNKKSKLNLFRILTEKDRKNPNAFLLLRPVERYTLEFYIFRKVRGDITKKT